jgi:hypothetical protein
VLRRVEEGAIVIPDTEPYEFTVFDSMHEASLRYDGLDSCVAPLMVNVPDGRAVIAALRNCGSSKVRSIR